MEMTEQDVSDLNSVLDNKMFLTFGVGECDLVQVSGEWVKFRFPKKGATAVLQRRSLRPSKDAGTVSAKGKDGVWLVISGDPAGASALSGKWGRITAVSKSGESRLVGQFQYVNGELFLPFGADGFPVDDYEIIKVGKEDVFVSKDGIPDGLGNETRVRLEPPLAYRAVVVSVGDKAKSDSVSFAYRTADYDIKTTPLYGFSEILGTDEKLEESGSLLVESAQNATGRRMKLFKAAEHEGAEIKTHGDWIAAICYKYRQCHVFGRLKPKVIPGTNEIDPACNLEDWEGITPENKAKRDDPHAEWVKDGISDGHGHVFDKLSGESGQPRVSFGCETAWCNCGVLNRDGAWEPRDRTNMYFEYYNNGGKTPYVIFMDTTRGALYEYVKIHRASGDIVNFLNEDDKTDGGTFGNPPDSEQVAFFAKFCDVRPDFREFVAKIDAEYFS